MTRFIDTRSGELMQTKCHCCGELVTSWKEDIEATSECRNCGMNLLLDDEENKTELKSAESELKSAESELKSAELKSAKQESDKNTNITVIIPRRTKNKTAQSNPRYTHSSKSLTEPRIAQKIEKITPLSTKDKDKTTSASAKSKSEQVNRVKSAFANAQKTNFQPDLVFEEINKAKRQKNNENSKKVKIVLPMDLRRKSVNNLSKIKSLKNDINRKSETTHVKKLSNLKKHKNTDESLSFIDFKTIALSKSERKYLGERTFKNQNDSDDQVQTTPKQFNIKKLNNINNTPSKKKSIFKIISAKLTGKSPTTQKPTKQEKSAKENPTRIII